MSGMTYGDAGVNLELGDKASEILYNASKLTWENRKGRLDEVVELYDDFSGLRAINAGNLPKDTYMNLGFDGVGTKTEIAERVGMHDTVAYDLFAMVCDDAVVRGAEPVIVGSILDVNSLEENIDFVKQLALGYVNAAREANVAVVNGEIAELGARVQGYGNFNYNWGAGVLWLANKNRMLTGEAINHGDFLVGLEETGLRSNGLSLVRKILENEYGEDWHNEEPNLSSKILTPSRIYSRAVVEMFGGYDGEPRAEVHAVVHVTGGGVPGKLERGLKPSGLGANIEDPFDPSDMMKQLQYLGRVSDKNAYKTWNMGQGMIIITPDPTNVIEIAKENNINSRIIGEVTKNQGISIISKGTERPGEKLNFG